jgi:hypothetical protein
MAQPLIIPYIEANHQSIECNFYATMGVNAYAAALASAFTGQFYVTGGLALVGGAAELAYNLAGCNGDPPPTPVEPQPVFTGCEKFSSGAGCINPLQENGQGTDGGGCNAYTQILNVTTNPAAVGPNEDLCRVEYIDPNGNESVIRWGATLGNFVMKKTAPYFSTRPQNAQSICETPAPEPPPPTPDPPGTPIAPPQTHTDENGCNWTIQATDAYVDEAGQWHTYYEITADDPACGGPFGYWSGPDGPDFVPVPPDSPSPAPPPGVNPNKECCDELKTDLAAIKEQLDVIQQCACGDPKPELLGDWISIRFISDGVSPNGTAPLRKLFRYRSQSSRNEQQLREYWEGFTWQAGPVIVQHKGTWWGTPQVWASSAEEGKRVLRFAAGEAGATPDTDGEWIVTGSASARYGMPGTMRIQQYRGRDWVTQRVGPSGPVEL